MAFSCILKTVFSKNCHKIRQLAGLWAGLLVQWIYLFKGLKGFSLVTTRKKIASKNQKPIIIYGDGACSGNPGPGGWACIIATSEGMVYERAGSRPESTNNKMELTAIGKALREIEGLAGDVVIYTDSKYVIEGITKWVHGWRANGWKKSDGKEVSNVEYWKRLVELVEARNDKITWEHVKGHAGNSGNERCDELATAYCKGRKLSLYEGPIEDYKIKL